MPENQITVRPLHFLLVEDDPDHAELILHVISEQNVGHTSEHVADGAAALEHLERVKRGETKYPDIVLLDLKLPKVDGLEVLDSMKTDSELRSLPVVVLTTSDAESDRARAYHNHANSYFVKPVSYEKFGALVEELSIYWGGWDKGAR
jgi:CheY-like chemotaxis protein